MDKQLRELERAAHAGDHDARVRWWARAHGTVPPTITAEMMEARGLEDGDVEFPKAEWSGYHRITQWPWFSAAQWHRAVKRLRKMRGLRTAGTDCTWTITAVTEETTITVSGIHPENRPPSKGERKRTQARRRKSRRRKRWHR